MLLFAGLFGVLASGLLIGPMFGEDLDDAAEQEAEEDAAAAEDMAPMDGHGVSSLMDAMSGGDADGGDVGAPIGPDQEDAVYGQHIGDQMGASLYDALGFSGHAVTLAVGDDVATGDGDGDMMFGNEGDDTLSGGGGRDMLHGDEGDDLIDGGSGGDVLDGGDGDDLMHGDGGSDLMIGGEGDDTLMGGAGDDQLFGQLGADVLDGGAGNDVLDGTFAGTAQEAGSDHDDGDTLRGGAGDDLLILGAGDAAIGGTGADSFVTGAHVGEDAPDISDFEAGTDVIEILYDASAGTTPEVSFEPLAGGMNLLLDGQVVAYVEDVFTLSEADFRLIPLAP